MLRKISPVFLCLLSGLLLALPFCNGKFWIFSWAGFVPVFLSLSGKSIKQSFFQFFITGVVFWSIVIYWLVHITLAGTIVLILYLALYFALFGLIIRPCTKQSRAYVILFIPSVWVLLEYCRGYLLTGFPWALLGYSQYLNLPIIQVADITGTYGVSFLIVMVNVALIELFKGKKQVKLSLIFCAVLISLSLIYGYYKIWQPARPSEQQRPVKISLIQGNIPQELKWNPASQRPIIEKHLKLSQLAVQDKPRLIVWPEASLPVIPGESPELFAEVKNFTKSSGIPFLLGAVTSRRSLYYNSAILIPSQEGPLTQYDKVHLVPFGEYIPLRKVLPFLETVVPIGDVAAGSEYTIFKLGEENLKFAVLICFEDVFPLLARKFTKMGADFLVNITNDGWYRKTSAPYQHLQASVFRAVENRVYLVRSANTGVSAFIGPMGKIISTVMDKSGKEIFIEGYKTGEIKVYKRNLSFYSRFGDIFILVCFIVVLGEAIRKRKARV